MARIPLKIGKYRVLSLVGEGGMGAVYKAEHPTLKRNVIIKKLTLTSSRDFAERFKREASIMMDFRNEHIVQVFDHFKEGKAFYIVMEFVDGITLEDLIEKKRLLSDEAAMLIFTEICRALKYAHDHQVIHRDIKPANILISKSGVVKLVDFGVSATLEEADEDGLTKAGMTIGTPSYLAPEQIANARNRDKRSDIYSMGVMLYEMVIGKKPFRGGFTPEVIARIEKGKYTPPGKINPKVKPVVRKVIKKAMHHKVRKRYQDLGFVIARFAKYLKKYRDQSDINNAIKRCLENKENSEIAPKKRKPAAFSSNLLRFFALAIVLLALIGGGVFWARQQGYHYEYLYPNEFGALRLVVKMRKGHKTLEQNYIEAVLYSEENDRLLKQKNVVFNFKEDTQIRSKYFFTLTSQKIYLKEGIYKILLYAENEQYRENFYLSPRSLQKSKLGSSGYREIAFSVGTHPPKLPVQLICRIADMRTGRLLTESAEISAFLNGKWVDWQDLTLDNDQKKSFTSSRKYRFRFKHQRYYTKFYQVTVRPEQSVLTLNMKMVPLPGELRLKTNTSDVVVLLNNSAFYIDGGKNQKYQRIPPLTLDFQKLILTPGEYYLTAKKKNMLFKESSSTRKIQIQSGQKLYLSIRVNPNDLSMQFIQK